MGLETYGQYVFLRKWVWSKVPIYGQSIEVQDAQELVASRISEARAAVAVDTGHLSDAQVKALSDAVETQAGRSVESIETADSILEELGKILSLRRVLDDNLPGLSARLETAGAAIPDALESETQVLVKLAGSARAAIANSLSASTLNSAHSEVSGVEEAREIILADVARRAGALGELGAERLNEIAGKLGSARLSALAALVHPPVAGLLDGSQISLDELATVLDGSLGGNVEILGALLETGCARDPAKLREFAVEFAEGSEAQADLSTLVHSGGLEGFPAALGQIFAIGCSGNPRDLADFAAQYRDEAERGKLQGLLEKGGLGDAPAALGHVVKAGGADMLQALGDAFEEDTELGQLGEMIRIGGLGGTTARSADVLAMMLQNGVDSPEGLKTLYADFGPDDLGDMRRMLSALDLRPPEDRDPGHQFNAVASKIGAPPADMKADYYDVIDQGARGAASEALIHGCARQKDVAAMMAATARSTDPRTAQMRSATMGGAMTLTALTGVPGVDAATVGLLTGAVEAAALAADTAAGLAALQADGADPKTVAEQAILSSLEESGEEVTAKAIADATEQATTAAAEARDAAILAEQALSGADPGTKPLIDAAQKAASEALAKARLCPDDTVRAEATSAAEACIAAIRATVTAVSSAALAAATTAAQTESMTSSDTARAACTAGINARKALGDDVLEKKKAFEQAVEDGIEGLAPVELNLELEEAQAAFDAAANARNQAVAAMDAAADNAAQLAIASKTLTTPAILDAQAEAERLAKLAELPAATLEEKQAALDAKGAVAKALADAMVTDLGHGVTAIPNPNAGNLGAMVPADCASGDDLYRAAIALKATLSAALSWREAAMEAWRAQEMLATRARTTANLPGATVDEETDADDADQKLADLGDRLQEANDALEAVADQAKSLDKKVVKNVRVNERYHNHIRDNVGPGAELDAQKDKWDKAVEAAAMCAVIVKRCQSAGFPAMSRDQLLAISSTMQKSPTDAMAEHDDIGGQKEADTKHFCGRHTREFFGFEGRDFYPEDYLLDIAIEKAATGDTSFGGPIGQMKTTSLWPIGFGEAEVKACLALAITAAEASVAPQSLYASVYANSNNHRKQFKDVEITYAGETYKVNIGFTAKANQTDDPNIEVGQFVPVSTPSVPFFDMHTIKKAMKF